MAIMGVCGAVLLAGLVLGIRWSTLPFTPPPPIDAPGPGEVARRFAWYCSLLILGAGIAAGVSVIGRRRPPRDAAARRHRRRRRPGPDHRGGGGRRRDHRRRHDRLRRVHRRLRWAVRGRDLPRDPPAAPAGWLGGLTFGAGLLVVLGTTADPLRDENPDFDIVGPGGWRCWCSPRWPSPSVWCWPGSWRASAPGCRCRRRTGRCCCATCRSRRGGSRVSVTALLAVRRARRRGDPVAAARPSGPLTDRGAARPRSLARRRRALPARRHPERRRHRRAASARRRRQPCCISAMRRPISSSETSSTWVATVHSWPHGSLNIPERSP